MIDPFSWLAGWIQEHWLIPVLYHFGWMEWEDTSFLWAMFAIYGVLQVGLNLSVCMPLERFWPLQKWPTREAVGTDILYTLIARIGLFPLVTFFLFYQAQTWLSGVLTDRGYIPPTLETTFPMLIDHPVITFFLYAFLLDFADYWRHRFSHIFGWWYGLHAIHHAQEKMTFWSDDRNHLLDDTITYLWAVIIGLLIGVPPLQFPLLMLMLRFVEGLSHANTRVGFGWLGERLLVSPQFHRVHHGHKAAGRRSCNFGAVFPWWDMLFRTADFSHDVVETGDPRADRAMIDGGWWAQQRAGLRLSARLAFRRWGHTTTPAKPSVSTASPNT
ncbi:sterol desaturase family protein [Ameyamaea chiangmaiensis]|uniref:Sterol desaturase family protein n=1 Tax=Ameyamaea chiangmaiensis TaxID=442969 RepID=A0A850PFH9_9PROT|nr:sterol desaturase family protein [Ameyamaea chiangmaiensis]MBS4075346.1 sterol desaturase family protein [Ameyamaea chiangmaiensis]NVN40662.1 sterol desaturase family protein [Ameyamaea chiangmaiensis]